MATPAAGAGAPPAENPYGLMAALEEGGAIAWATFIILVIMSAASWYILFVKLFEQQKIINQGKRARTTFWQSANPREGANKLECGHQAIGIFTCGSAAACCWSSCHDMNFLSLIF